MKTNVTKILRRLLIVPLLAMSLSAIVAPTTFAQNCNDNRLTINQGANCAKGDQTPSNLFSGEGAIFQTITNVLLFLIGAVSVIMLIIGGIRYTISGGDQTAVTAAKNTILYAVIGIIVAILAFAIVNFVVGSFATN